MAPSATVVLTIDGGETKIIAIPGIVLPDGRFKYVSEWSSPTGVTLFVSYTLDAINNPTSSVSGQCKITNASASPRSVLASIDFTLCPDIPGGTLFGGAVTMLVQTNGDGGGVTCAPGAISAWSAHISGSEYQGLFYCPFQMTKTGSGSIQASTQFGTPVPSKPGPYSANGMSLHHRFTITAGEIATTTSSIAVKSLGVPSACDADLNVDGIVSADDVGVMLGNWGQGGWCISGDVNHDGMVDGNDLGGILGNWGPCQ